MKSSSSFTLNLATSLFNCARMIYTSRLKSQSMYTAAAAFDLGKLAEDDQSTLVEYGIFLGTFFIWLTSQVLIFLGVLEAYAFDSRPNFARIKYPLMYLDVRT